MYLLKKPSMFKFINFLNSKNKSEMYSLVIFVLKSKRINNAKNKTKNTYCKILYLNLPTKSNIPKTKKYIT